MPGFCSKPPGHAGARNDGRSRGKRYGPDASGHTCRTGSNMCNGGWRRAIFIESGRGDRHLASCFTLGCSGADGSNPETSAALRQIPGRALQPYQRASQIPAWIRCGRRPVLAGTDAERRGRSEIHREATDPVRGRGYRDGRSRCASTIASRLGSL